MSGAHSAVLCQCQVRCSEIFFRLHYNTYNHMISLALASLMLSVLTCKTSIQLMLTRGLRMPRESNRPTLRPDGYSVSRDGRWRGEEQILFCRFISFISNAYHQMAEVSVEDKPERTFVIDTVFCPTRPNCRTMKTHFSSLGPFRGFRPAKPGKLMWSLMTIMSPQW